MGPVIFPASGKRYDWIPKTDDGEKIGVEAMTDTELQDLIAPTDVDVEEALLGPAGETPEIDAIEVTVEGDISEDAPENGDEAPVDEGTTIEEKAEEVVEKLQDAKETMEEVIELAVGEDGTVDLEESGDDIGDKIVDEIADESSLEGELAAETPGESEDSAIEKETCEMCGSAVSLSPEANAEEATVVAGDSRRFVKVAALSPDNKKKVRDYWVNVLGYDAKYVDYMVTDYEK